jgi:hypothetical protein
MTGIGCNTSAFSKGELACSGGIQTAKFKKEDVFGERAVTASGTKRDQTDLTPVEFRVNEPGAATYHLPINLPVGTSGVTPQVSLNPTS